MAILSSATEVNGCVTSSAHTEIL